MATKVFRFRNIEEAEGFKWQEILRKRLPYWEFDRYEYARLQIKFTPGVHRFKNIEAKREWEFQEVCRKWKKQS